MHLVTQVKQLPGFEPGSPVWEVDDLPTEISLPLVYSCYYHKYILKYIIINIVFHLFATHRYYSTILYNCLCLIHISWIWILNWDKEKTAFPSQLVIYKSLTMPILCYRNCSWETICLVQILQTSSDCIELVLLWCNTSWSLHNPWVTSCYVLTVYTFFYWHWFTWCSFHHVLCFVPSSSRVGPLTSKSPKPFHPLMACSTVSNLYKKAWSSFYSNAKYFVNCVANLKLYRFHWWLNVQWWIKPP